MSFARFVARPAVVSGMTARGNARTRPSQQTSPAPDPDEAIEEPSSDSLSSEGQPLDQEHT